MAIDKNEDRVVRMVSNNLLRVELYVILKKYL